MRQLTKLSLFIFILFSFISCQTTDSKKLIEPSYELENQAEYRYSYNLKRLKDSTLLDYFFYFQGKLALSRRSITISRYNSENNLILEQEYEKDKEELKLVGERHLYYNGRHQLIKDIQINDGQVFMKTFLEYNDFDSVSKVSTIIKHTASTLEEAARENKKNVRYDTSIVQYLYNEKKQRISPDFITDQLPEIIKLNDTESIHVIKNAKLGIIDSNLYKRDVLIRSTSISNYEGIISKTTSYYNSHGDIIKSITLKRIN